MKRRAFLYGPMAMLATPLGAVAQQAAKILESAIWAARLATNPTTMLFKTAKALGLTIPPSLLARADQVIE